MKIGVLYAREICEADCLRGFGEGGKLPLVCKVLPS